MSLANLYNKVYGGEVEHTAADVKAGAEQEAVKLAGIIDKAEFTDEDCTKLAEACDLLDAEGIDFESAEQKLATAADVVDKVESGEIVLEDGQDEDERTASELDAAGRIMARSFVDELSGEGESTLTSKLSSIM